MLLKLNYLILINFITRLNSKFKLIHDTSLGCKKLIV